MIQEAPLTEDLTYRQLLSWVAELTGTCGFIDWDGHLILKWYTETNTVLDLSDRFKSDLDENAVEISGVQVVTEEETYLVGDDGYAFNIEGNELIQHDYRAVAQALFNVLGGFSYLLPKYARHEHRSRRNEYPQSVLHDLRSMR